jgi:hypothetical protein
MFVFHVGASKNETSIRPSAPQRLLWSRFNALTIQPFNVREAMTRLRFFPRYSSLLGQCLRLVSYATGALPDVRLRAFHRRSPLPSLRYRIAGNSVAAL